MKYYKRSLKFRSRKINDFQRLLSFAGTIGRSHYDETIDNDEGISIQFRRHCAGSNVPFPRRINNDVDYYGPLRSESSSNRNCLYMNESTKLSPYEQGNPDTYDEKVIKKEGDASSPEYVACEVDRGITRSKNRSYCNDASINAHYERCAVSSSDDTSNKRKVVADTDVSTTSLTPTNISSVTKNKNNRKINFSIPISSLNDLDNDGELLFKVSVIRNGKSKSSSTPSNNDSKWDESRGNLSRNEWKKLRYKMNRITKRKEAVRLRELLDENNALPKDKLRPNNRNAVAKPHVQELTIDNVKNALPNVKLYSNTTNFVRNSNVHNINDNKCTTLVTNVIVVPVGDNHIGHMAKDCENSSVQAGVDASVVSQ